MSASTIHATGDGQLRYQLIHALKRQNLFRRRAPGHHPVDDGHSTPVDWYLRGIASASRRTMGRECAGSLVRPEEPRHAAPQQQDTAVSRHDGPVPPQHVRDTLLCDPHLARDGRLKRSAGRVAVDHVVTGSNTVPAPLAGYTSPSCLRCGCCVGVPAIGRSPSPPMPERDRLPKRSRRCRRAHGGVKTNSPQPRKVTGCSDRFGRHGEYRPPRHECQAPGLGITA